MSKPRVKRRECWVWGNNRWLTALMVVGVKPSKAAHDCGPGRWILMREVRRVKEAKR